LVFPRRETNPRLNKTGGLRIKEGKVSFGKGEKGVEDAG